MIVKLGQVWTHVNGDTYEIIRIRLLVGIRAILKTLDTTFLDLLNLETQTIVPNFPARNLRFKPWTLKSEVALESEVGDVLSEILGISS